MINTNTESGAKVMTGQEMERQLLEDLLERRYGPAAAQGVLDALKEQEEKKMKIDYLDVKHMADTAAEFRGRVRRVLSQYRQWQANQPANEDGLTDFYFERKGMMLRQDLATARRRYKASNRQFCRLMREYYNQVTRDHTTPDNEDEQHHIINLI